MSDLAEQVAGLHPANLRSVGPGDQCPVCVIDDSLHELVGHPHRVVRVLILNREGISSVEVHVEPGVAQYTCLALLERLAPDEVLDVGVVDIENDHLRRTSRFPSALDGSG